MGGTVAGVIERMDAYDNYAACQRITEFVDALSNWYVRRSRDRFWAADRESPDKLDAHWTLYECLLTVTKLVAPFVPFVAEAIWQTLAVAAFSGRALESVHWCDFPAPPAGPGDVELSDRMRLVREVVSQGRAARMAAKLKVRQPLAKVEVILADRQHLAWLEEHRAPGGRRTERQGGRISPPGRPIHQLHDPARLETPWPPAGQTLAGRQSSGWPPPMPRSFSPGSSRVGTSSSSWPTDR